MSVPASQPAREEATADTPPDRYAAAGLAAIVGQLQGLKPFPESAQRLLLVLWDPNHDSAEVVKVIERDPTLTAKVLRLVNSSLFGLRKPCESISRAVMLLGSRQVAEVAVAQIALSQFDDAGPLSRTIAEHCQLVGVLCRKLAARRKLLRNVDVFTPGMLHDLGKLLMLQVDQGEYERLVQEAPQEPDALHAIERAHYGYDHAVLADYVMEQWCLPTALRELIRLHHDLESARQVTPAVYEATAVLRAADKLSYALRSSRPPAELSAELATAPEFAVLELDAARLLTLWPDLSSLVA